jgi:hypothetical protein
MDQTEGSLGMFKSLGIDIFKTINESKFLKGVLNFVLSLLGFTGGFEGLQKRWYSRRIDRQLDDQKRSQISSIFQEYLRQTNTSPIAEENKLTSILKQKITFPPNTEQLFNIDQPALKSSISEKITNPADLNPAVIRAVAGGSYLTTTSEEVEQIKNGKTKTVKVKKETVNAEKFNKDKEKIIPKYLEYMTKQLAGNADYLQNIDSADTVAFTMISSLFVQPDHVIDGIKAKVFLPEAFVEGNYQPRVEQPTIPNTPTAFVDNFTEAKKAVLTQELQAVSSPLTAEMIVQSAQKSAIPVAYLTAVIKNDSSYGTTGVGARTNNPGNVGNTDNGNTRNFPSREAGLDAAAGVIKSRIDAYKTAYPTETGIPPLKNLLENR